MCFHFFALDQSFLDPKLNKDGTPYGPARFKKIVEECWYISDNLHTSYTDILDISTQERIYLIEFINRKAEATSEAMKKIQMESQLNKKLK